MRKLLAAGILAVFALSLPSRSRAVPLDVPYIGTTSGTAVGSVTLSTTSLTNIAYQWCLSHVVVSAPSASTFTMYYSTMSTLTPSTTNYAVVVATGIPYDVKWAYRTPYCAPAGNYLTLQSSVVTSTITYEGYSYKGWNP